MRFYRLLLLIIGILWLSNLTIQTDAHGYIVRSIPEDRATLERPPTRLQYWFSESLEPQFSSITLRDENGAVIAEGGVDADDNTLLRLQVPPELPEGAYIVQLSPAFASDSHVVNESRVFFVGDAISGVEGEAASAYGEPLEVLWKALLYASTYLLFGTLVLYAYILVPIWGSKKYAAGLLPPRLMRRISLTVVIAVSVAFAANVLALLQQTMIFFSVDAVTAITGGLWQVVRIGSRSGDMWNARTFFLLLIALAQFGAWYYWQRKPRFVRSFLTAQVWAAALLIGTQAVNSHAAGALVWPWVAVTNHWLHALAVAFWVGGIAALVLILPVALAPYADEARWQALRPVMRRFSRYVLGSVALVITTGIYSTTNWFYTPSDFATSYGASLGYKMVLVVGLLLVGGLHHVTLRPHLLAYVPFKGAVDWARNFTGSMRVEAFLVVLGLGTAALLSATPIPEPEFLQQETPTQTASVELGDLNVQAALIPGAPGVNTIDLVIRRGDTPVDALQIEAQIVSPERDIRSQWRQPDQLETGVYVLTTDFTDEAGRWLTLIDLRAADDTLQRAAFEWTISEEAAVLQSLPPSIWNLLALGLVIAALIYVVYPSLAVLAQRMDWSPANVVVAVGITLISIIVMIGSIQFVNDQLAQVDERLNPLPEIVNPTLPDAASLAQGQALYLANCNNMQTASDFFDLRQQLDRLGDETLFDALERGWRDVPPCRNELDPDQRWHVVNYLRTLRL